MSVTGRYQKQLDAACVAADQSRIVTLAGFRSELDVDDKSLEASADVDPVTEADRNSEAVIRLALGEVFPDLEFLGEESSDVGDRPEGLHWIVDPIDGTRAYICGIPTWSTLIALQEGEHPVFGVVDFPALAERFVGFGDKASRWVEGAAHTVTVRNGVPLDQAIMCCTTPDMYATSAQQRAFRRVRDAVGMTRFGTDAYGYAMLAAGQIDLVVEADLAPWDTAAVAALVRAAGGVITDWEGRDSLESGQIVAAANPELHAQVLEHLAASL